jgi:S-DNA-T family DNA segregation ATPase FtsK/SpoIIIE
MAKGKGKGSAGGAASEGRRFPYGRIALGLLCLAMALGLLFYFYSPAREGASTAFEAFLEWFGIGLLIAGLLVLSWVVWRRRGTPSLRKWRIAVGVLILILVMFGILSSFKPAAGSFSDYGYGGVIGQAMIGWPTTTAGYVAGALRLAAMVILAVFLLAPRQSWDISKKIFSGLASFYRRYPLHRYLWMSLCGWGRLFSTLSRAASNRQRQRRARPAVTPVAHVMHEPPPTAREPVQAEAVEPVPEPAAESYESVAVDESVAPAGTFAEGGEHWQLPSLGLLERNPEAEPVPVDTERGTRIIEDALASYGVNAKVVQANVGPAVTQYGVEPGWDIKTKEVKKKDKDGNITVQVEEVSRTRVKVR